MALTLTDLENRVVALENKNSKLLRLLRASRPRTDNPLSLATDLDDVGSVQTWLEFWEIAKPASTPKAETLYLYVSAGAEGARLTYVDEAGIVIDPLGSLDGELQFAQGTETMTVASGTKAETATVTHSKSWSTVGRVFLTIQNVSAVADNERPVSAHAFTVGADAFNISVDTLINVASNRQINVGWICMGVL